MMVQWMCNVTYINGNEMMVQRMCNVTLKDRKSSEEFRDYLGLVSITAYKGVG